MAELTRENIIEAIEKMSVLELNQLVKDLEQKFGVSAAAPMGMMMAAPAAAGEEAKKEEQTEFNVMLTAYDEKKKIGVLKAVRAVTNLGLKEAKELVESVPKPVKESISKDEAAKIKKELEEAGGTVEVK